MVPEWGDGRGQPQVAADEQGGAGGDGRQTLPGQGAADDDPGDQADEEAA